MAPRIMVGTAVALGVVAVVVAGRSFATSPSSPVEQEPRIVRSAEAVGDQEGVSEKAQRHFRSYEERVNYVQDHPEEMRRQTLASIESSGVDAAGPDDISR